MKWSTTIRKLWVGGTLRCPNCEQGHMFTGLLAMRRVCPVCGVLFERQSGDSVGAMYINMGITTMTALGGFFLANTLFHPPMGPHIVFWVAYTLIFTTLFHRHARGISVAIYYLTVGLQKDEVEMRSAGDGT